MVSDWIVAGQVLGGLGLFLLALTLLTEGLQMMSRSFFQTILSRFTRTPLRSLLLGIVTTAFLQSSSAVTVILLGLVNASTLSLSRALYVIFGANIGTTMTGWLVSLTGMQFDMKAAALPLIGIGMSLRIFSHKNFLLAIGLVLTGFGLFFVGVDILQSAFKTYVLTIENFITMGHEPFSLIYLLFIGFLMTVAMQSSSASTAIILTGAASGIMTINGAAAMVIGANLGTTVTAVAASFGASPNARRVAVAHVLFNLVTGIVSWALVSKILIGIQWVATALGWASLPMVVTLALFHTIFNVMGCVLMVPMVPLMTRQLEKIFRSSSEDIAKPRFIDQTGLRMPALALDAVILELQNLKSMLYCEMGNLLEERQGRKVNQDIYRALSALSNAITIYCETIAQEKFSSNVELLQASFRINRYLQEILRLRPHIDQLWILFDKMDKQSKSTQLLSQFLAQCHVVFVQMNQKGSFPKTSLRELWHRYEALKQAILLSGTQKEISTETLYLLLDHISHIRRIIEQAVKANRWLNKVSNQKKNE